jgi:hypothetical protein
MHFSKDAIYTDANKAAPAPAPWYMSQPASDLSTPSLALKWERDPDAGPSGRVAHSSRTTKPRVTQSSRYHRLGGPRRERKASRLKTLASANSIEPSKSDHADPAQKYRRRFRNRGFRRYQREISGISRIGPALK